MERSDVGTDEEARGQGFTFIGLDWHLAFGE